MTSEEKKLLTSDQRKLMVDKLLVIAQGDDLNLAFRAISKIIELVERNRRGHE